ncbi:hypothetical protein CCAX7_48910 [Capsulimonas corticalis]|uniref:Uncharacterized protein n=1 Tax=Capsulimonas corticalis TaxID=2219043 RepID=A0A402CQ61_9BACT|nr:hypothetical protein [Capsulimonas corticalis]BDI32840.1 hypothetical protein CCAX7_48910 [Capsulimonas corticalis]
MSKLTRGHGGRCSKALPLIVMLASLIAGAPSHAKAPSFKWEKIHLRYMRPSQVFASLGLDHTVRYGHTRGDGKAGTDPNFPAGMTDIVPYDADKTLIIRGTPEGCAKFRQTVLAADVAPPRWRIEAELFRVRNNQPESVARETLDSVTPDKLQKLMFNVDGLDRDYQLHLHASADGSIDIAYQYSMQLPPSPIAPDASDTHPAPGVFVPAQIWSASSTQITRLGETRLFDDLASQRQVAGRTPDGDPANGVQVLGDDYRLQLTILPATEAPAPGAAIPIPTPER